MKTLFIALVLLFFVSGSVSSQNIKVPSIGSKAPSFTAKSTMGELTFPNAFGNSWKILFSHPQDFTPVCSTELLELANMKSDFDSLGVMIAVISTDDLNQHNNWKKHLEEINYKSHGKQKINFPLFEDQRHTVAKMYGMIHGAVSTSRDIRGVFVIDSENIIRSINFYPKELGRNMHEITRIVEALQRSDSEQVVIPANWNEGDDVMVSYRPYTEQQLVMNPKIADNYYNLGNMLWFKKGGK